MALDKQIVPISFAQGLDTKTDSKQVVAGKMLELENVVFTKTMQFSKRNGYTKLPSAGTQGSALVDYQGELIAFDSLNVQSYAKALNSFSNKGQALSLDATSLPVVSNSYEQTSMDGAFHEYGLKTFVWEDSRGGIRYSVIDSDTSQVIVNDTQVHASGVRPKVFALGNYIIITYYDGTNLVYKSFSVSTPGTLSSQADLATDVNTTNPVYDAYRIGTRLYFAYNTSNASSSVAVSYMGSTLSVATAYEEVGEAATVCIGIFSDSNDNVFVSYYNGTAVKIFMVDYALNSIVSPTPIETVSNVRNITGAITSETSSSVSTSKVFYEISASTTYNYLVRSCELSLSSTTITPGTPAVFIRSVGLASKAFTYNSNQYLGLAYESTLQPTYFIATFDGLIVSKCVALNAGGLTDKSILPEVAQVSDSIFQIAWGKKDSLEVESGNVYSSIGVVGETISFLSKNTYLTATAANNLHITGGFLSMYDGTSVVEHGFHLYPEASTITQATSGGGIQAGTFQYKVVYEWKDNQGKVHESAPSVAQTVEVGTGGTLNFTADTTNGDATLASVSSFTGLFVGQLITGTGIPANTYITALDSGASELTMSNAATATGSTVTISTIYTNKVTLAIPTLRVTAKQSPRADVTISVYRTQDAGTVFYLVSSISSPTINDTTADTVSFEDTVPDLYLSGNRVLYTTGGVLENSPAPSCSLIANYKNRIIVVPSETENEYWISKEVSAGYPVLFSGFFTKPVNPAGGKITAIREMDEKIIIFKRDLIMLAAGDGPNDVGQQDSLSSTQLVTTDVGCENPRSVVYMPLGLMFKSTKGIYLLDRSLQAQYIGAPVEAYNDLEITSSQLVPDTNQVRFTTAEGRTLVYDYLINQWYTFTNVKAVDSAIFEKKFTYINSTGTVFQESPGTYLDGSSPIKIKIVTSWLQFAGIQGFQRIYQTLILGEYKSLNKLQVSVAYDFNPNATQTVTADATILQPTTYGEDSPYGSGTPYGGNYPLYQFRIDMARQKCQAFQLILEEVPQIPYGEGLSLSAFTSLAGVKKGLYKVPSAVQV